MSTTEMLKKIDDAIAALVAVRAELSKPTVVAPAPDPGPRPLSGGGPGEE